jgi:ABC-type sugar transport system ATPase subunit
VAALLGPSGSGKSTLLNLVSGIDAPDAGTVEVAGDPLHALSERDRTLARRDRVGFVFQFFNLIPTLTVLENLLLPLELRGGVGRGPVSGPGSSWGGWGSRTGKVPGRTGSREESSSGWRWPGPSCTPPR